MTRFAPLFVDAITQKQIVPLKTHSYAFLGLRWWTTVDTSPAIS